MKIHPAHVELRFRPIQAWPGPITAELKSDRFDSTPGRTQTDLRGELAAIGVRSAVIQADVFEDDLRRDGMFRANAKFGSSRVIVAFEHPDQGSVSFPCWTYRSFWANLRAVVKTLEALRAIDRHGASRNAQQYTGWKQLPASATASDAFVTVEDAVRYLAKVQNPDSTMDPRVVELAIEDAEIRKGLYRAACRHAHPDAGGSDAMMARVNAAKDMIDRAATA